MAKISGKETKPEVKVRKYLYANGLRYRKNLKALPGKPDIVLKKYNTVIFVHGCFWHGHKDCSRGKLPTTNTEFWRKKISLNKVRDEKTIAELKVLGWNVIIIWQCQLKNVNSTSLTLNQLFLKILQLKQSKHD